MLDVPKHLSTDLSDDEVEAQPKPGVAYCTVSFTNKLLFSISLINLLSTRLKETQCKPVIQKLQKSVNVY